MMYLNLLISLLAGLPLAASAAVAAPGWEHSLIQERQTPSNQCSPTVHLIVAGGEGTGGTNYGLFSTFVNNVTSMIPGSNNYLLPPYDQSIPFPNQTGLAEQILRQYIQQYSQSCPYTYLALAGYSEGAVTTMNALCGATVVPPWNATTPIWPQYKGQLIASVAYGDELYEGDQPYDNSNCTNNAPKGHRDSSGCTGFFRHMASYCFSDDPYCCAGGNYTESHDLYPETYDVKAAKFVKRQWLKAMKRDWKHHPY